MSGTPTRSPNGILGLIIKKHYPGLITLDDGTQVVPWHWSDFYKVNDVHEVPIATTIKMEFWDWYTCDAGYEERASAVQERSTMARVKDMYYEAHVQVLLTYFTDVKERISKNEAKRMLHYPETDLDKEIYMQFPAEWCKTYMDCWKAIVDKWRTPESYEERRHRSDRTKMRQGPAHHQGSRSLTQFMDAWSRSHEGQVINEYEGYALSHKGKATDPNNVFSSADGPEAYTNPNAYEKMALYTEAARQRYGPDYDPSQQPLDTDLVMRTGGGKQHGQYFIAHSAIDPTTVSTLRQIRRSASTTSDVPIWPRQASTLAAVQSELPSCGPRRRPRARPIGGRWRPERRPIGGR